MKRFALIVTLLGAMMLVPSARAQTIRTAYVPLVYGPPSGASAVEAHVSQLINAERAYRGLAPLTRDARLDGAAALHAADMAANDSCGHTGSDDSSLTDRLAAAGFPWSACGEVVAAGQATPETVVAAWMASAPHRAALLSGAFSTFGVGYAYREDSAYRHYWTVDLAAP